MGKRISITLSDARHAELEMLSKKNGDALAVFVAKIVERDALNDEKPKTEMLSTIFSDSLDADGLEMLKVALKGIFPRKHNQNSPMNPWRILQLMINQAHHGLSLPIIKGNMARDEWEFVAEEAGIDISKKEQ